MTLPLSGPQYNLRFGPYVATIAGVGATLRELRHSSRDLVQPFEADELRPNFQGAILVPWPNRIVDGRYRFNGAEEQLPLTEPTRGHALHGLVAWQLFDVVAHDESEITLACVVEPQEGYPHRLEVTVHYALGDAGLETTCTSRNIGSSPAPFGASAHPYLVAGPGRVDDWRLEFASDSYLSTVGARLLPGDEKAIREGEEFDFAAGRLIGATRIDHAFSATVARAVRLTAPDGRGVEMSWDDRCPWVQLFTGDLPVEADARQALAVEPMTCPPDAFNSGRDLQILEPGDELDVSWTIAALQ